MKKGSVYRREAAVLTRTDGGGLGDEDASKRTDGNADDLGTALRLRLRCSMGS
jgi:hypothetical protein